MELSERREIYDGFGETLARAFEMVLTPGIFAALGYLLDRVTGTFPLFAIVFFFWAFSYISWKMWSQYEQRMRAIEEEMGLRRPELRP